MQIIEADDVHAARLSYLELLGRRGIALDTTMTIYIETVHRSRQLGGGAWLCYIAQAMQHAA